jgi:glycosyltransferase involved in cell wall biosynthesis
MKKALVFIDYDMLIRHFVLNGTFDEIARTHEITYVFHRDTTSEKQGIFNDISALDLKNVEYFDVPRQRMGAWWKLNAATILHNQAGTPNHKPRKQRLVSVSGWLRTQYYSLLALPGIYDWFRKRELARLGMLEPLSDFVREHNPDIVIHPSILSGFFIQDLGPVCADLDIPFVVLMNSWDNPSGKAVVSSLPDCLVVWGPQTRQHAEAYLGIPPERVKSFGAAQFQIYRQPVTESDAELRVAFGVPPDIPILLYAGVSKSVNETNHLRALDAAIEAGEIPPCHIIYRPHPWRGVLVEGETSFFDIPFRHITLDPSMTEFYRRVVNEGVMEFYLADYDVTRRLLHLTAGTIAPLSTIMLETTMFGNPVLMYFPQEELENKFGKYNNITFKLAHFAEFWDCEGIEQCFDPEDLAQAVTRLIENAQDENIRAGLRAHAAQFVVLDGPDYATRLASLIDELAGDESALAGAAASPKIA